MIDKKRRLTVLRIIRPDHTTQKFWLIMRDRFPLLGPELVGVYPTQEKARIALRELRKHIK